MIDISMLAPAAQPTAPQGNSLAANSPKESAPGTKGFLRLFEIVLDGMPRPVQPQGDAGTTATSEAPLDPNAMLGDAAASTEASAALASETTLIPDQASLQIANLLQGLGFSVDAQQIMALGPLDRMQLDQAMEFVQRGLEAGMPTSELLENASFLMPREWDYQGPASASSPRTEAMAISAPESEGIDPAQVLAATEAVRRMLAGAMPGAVAAPSKTSESVPAKAQTAALASATDGATVSAAPSRDPAQPEAASAQETESVVAQAMHNVARPVRHERPGAAKVQGPSAEQPAQVPPSETKVSALSGSTRAPGSEPPATNAAVPAESGARVTDTSMAALQAAHGTHVPASESRIATAEGVKPGSMASEFIGRQVLEKVDVHLRQGKRELTVRLWPEELGEVRLSLRIGEADKLDARIMVQNEGVRQALLDATPQLREALARHGMEMGRLSVNVDSGRSETQMADGDRSDPGRREGRREAPQRGWREQEMEYAGALALGVDSGIRDGRNTLDMWS